VTALTALAGELHRTYHLADVDPGHPIRRAHDALIAAADRIAASERERDELAALLREACDWIAADCDIVDRINAALDGAKGNA